MGTIYEIIQQNPELSAWVFSVINLLAIGFAYFNKQRHERTLKVMEQDLRFSADRRLKIFELKATEYGAYAAKLDEFGKKVRILSKTRCNQFSMNTLTIWCWLGNHKIKKWKEKLSFYLATIYLL